MQINRAVTGAGKVPEVNLRQQTNVTEGGYEINLQPVRIEGEKLIIPVMLENLGLQQSLICVRLDSMPKIRMKEKFYSVLLRHLMRNIFLRNQ